MDHFAPHPVSNFHTSPSAFISVPLESSPEPDAQQPHLVSVALPEPTKDSSKSARMEQEAAAPVAGGGGVALVISESEDGHKNGKNKAVERSRNLLFRRMLVGIKDGRFFLGCFHCMDKQGNIILQDTIEYRSTTRSKTSSSSPSSSPMEQRCLGLILIPASCRTTCHVDCTIEERLSLLSLQQQE